MPKADQGVQKNRYSLIPRTLIFIINGDHILLIKGSPTKRLWANRYNGVGGHIERDEDVLTSARRELFEETGLKAASLRLAGTVTVDTGDETGIGIYVLKGRYEGGQIAASHEGIPEWIPIHRLDQYPLVEDISILIEKILSQTREDPPFSTHYSYDSEDRLVISFADPGTS